MTPHLVRWHHTYRDDGFVVLDIDNGMIDSLDAVRGHLKSEGIAFPVLHDSQAVVTRLYGVQAYPTAFLVGRNGKIVWEGNPRPSEAESVIREALAGSGN